MKFHLPNFLVEISQGNSILGSMTSKLVAGVLFAAVISHTLTHLNRAMFLAFFVLTICGRKMLLFTILILTIKTSYFNLYFLSHML